MEVHREVKSIIIFFLIIILVAACQKVNSTNRVSETTDACLRNTLHPGGYMLNTMAVSNDSGNYCGFMPLGRNNYWVYLDSLYNSSGQLTAVVIDTLRFVQTFRSSDSLVWWQPNKWKGFLTYNYSTDSVLYTQGIGLSYINPVQWAYDINQDSLFTACTLYYTSTICRAWKIPGTLSVPAGNFTQCLRFVKKYIGNEEFDIDFKPGVGVIKFRYSFVYTNLRIKSRTSTLLSYHIE